MISNQAILLAKRRVEQQSGLAGDCSWPSVVTTAIFGGSPILPDDRIVNGLPDWRSQMTVVSALIGNTDAGNILRRDLRCAMTARIVATTAVQISSGHARPGPRRIDLRQFHLRGASGCNAASNAIARVEVVPGRWQ
jgi:hypothetical protein